MRNLCSTTNFDDTDYKTLYVNKIALCYFISTVQNKTFASPFNKQVSIFILNK